MSLLWVKHKQTNEILLVVKNDSQYYNKWHGDWRLISYNGFKYLRIPTVPPDNFSHVLLAKNHFDKHGCEKTFRAHIVFIEYVPSYAFSQSHDSCTNEIGSWRCFVLIKATKKEKRIQTNKKFQGLFNCPVLTTDQRNRWVQASWPGLLALLNLQIFPGQSLGSWAGLQFGSHGQALPTRSLSRGECCGERPEKVRSCSPAAAIEESEDCTVKMRQHSLSGLETESSRSRYSTNKRVTYPSAAKSYCLML